MKRRPSVATAGQESKLFQLSIVMHIKQLYKLMIRNLYKRSWKLWDAPRPIAKAKGQMFGRRHRQNAEESIESVLRCGAYFEVGSRVAWNRKNISI